MKFKTHLRTYFFIAKWELLTWFFISADEKRATENDSIDSYSWKQKIRKSISQTVLDVLL